MADLRLAPVPGAPRSEFERVRDALINSGEVGFIFDRDWKLMWISPSMIEVMRPNINQLTAKQQDELFAVGTPVHETLHRIGGDNDGATELSDSYPLFSAIKGDPELPRETREEYEAMPGEAGDIWRKIEPTNPWPLFTNTFVFWTQGDVQQRNDVRASTVKLEGNHHEIGGFTTYSMGGLTAKTMMNLLQGDPEVLNRIAGLASPSRRGGAILFADLEQSTDLSRALPTATYFELIRRLWMRCDESVLRHRGVVGRHAGDGLTAFFLTGDVGSSCAVRCAISVARELTRQPDEIYREMSADGLPVPPDLALNVGVHFGEHLYVGQIATSGRLDVTALGDAVNEAARVQEASRGGKILATKAAVEQLSESDSVGLELDPLRLKYTTLRDLGPDVAQKVARDIAHLPVCEIA